MREILKVRFVNFGNDLKCTAQVLSFGGTGWSSTDLPFHLSYDPQTLTQNFGVTQNKIDVWIETLNSNDAPMPRIEKNPASSYHRIFVTDTLTCEITGAALNSLNQIYGKPAPIYEPKKFEAKWEQIYGRKFEPTEHQYIGEPTNYDIGYAQGEFDAIDKINLLQKPSPACLEVWELTVIEING